ncbi:phosphoribosylformylglycinamidine synthase subunit PurL [Micromonospora lutea]|uniref:Phosphoribosylformylglycinamidine synthase subunit PurL n=1 Tax=Micromonospora lutea TaxID=419825 RepID=A0ABQ4IWM0_9ACTN|nr:phosphoribosylformylglycinamidine synthase subunit PurL [Micromonospora lutea]GIJ22300.1 phosphoribosylformylglycinamidine synthase subunit PurL [Micromonospora lutea]
MTTHPDPVRESPEGVPAQSQAAAVPPVTPARHAAVREATDWTDGTDTVSRAAGTPEELQPYAELGLLDDEYDRIRHILGRRPTQSELAMYSIMWSEHCSYKSSKVHLRQFGEKAPPSDRLLAGIGENAGVVRISDELAVTFKVESHNHPSFVEPYQGAATGVGGIVRDILAMGARPVAVMDPLRFGAADHPDTARVLPGVVAGVGGYGNCLGLPNIGGEVVFDPCYQGNPLVNALCLGVLPVDRLQKKDATGPGNVVVLMGAKTGRDGIGGVSVLASATFTEGSEQRRPSVQVGDPFMEKLLIEACLELYDAELVVGIQDLGGAGLTCALTETAASAGTGMRVWLERVPLREPSMEPHEILASESQERMLLVVAPEKLEAVLKTAEKWGVWATAIGEVTAPEPDGSPGRLRITWRDHLVVDVPPGSLVDDGPVYARPMREPADLILLQADRAETLPRPADPDTLRETVLRMIASPNLCDKTWVTEQYDRYVLGNTVLAQPEDSGVIRIDERTGLGVALSVDGNGRYARLDPYQGAKLALAEAYRNVAVTGATPIAVTDCLNFGSPEDPGVMWQFAEAVRGLADGCAELGIPVTGGNVSFYNQTGAAAIHPTPVVGVLGVLENVADRVASGFVPRPGAEHDQLFLLGETHVELSGSEWAWVTHQHLGGVPPQVDLAREKQLAGLLADAARVGHLSSAHDLSDGGLAQSLVESCLRHGVGARIAVPERFAGNSMPFVFLFSESAGRVLVSVPRGHEKAFTALCGEHGVSWELIGVTDPTGGALEVHGQFRIGLDELRTAHTGTLPALFGGVQSFEVPAPAAAEVVFDAPVGAFEPAVDLDAVSGVDATDAATTAAGQNPEPASGGEQAAPTQAAPTQAAPTQAEPAQVEGVLAAEPTEAAADRPAERATPPVRTGQVELAEAADPAPTSSPEASGTDAPQHGDTEQPAAPDER